MGLFDKVFGQPSAATEKFNSQESFAAIALAMSAADGHIAQSEVQGIATYLNRMRLYEPYNSQQMQNMFDKLIRVLRKDGPSGLISRAKAGLPSELAQTAFACATDIVLADGVVEESEKQLLDELHNVLEVPENIALSIIQVMQIKNRG